MEVILWLIVWIICVIAAVIMVLASLVYQAAVALVSLMWAGLSSLFVVSLPVLYVLAGLLGIYLVLCLVLKIGLWLGEKIQTERKNASQKRERERCLQAAAINQARRLKENQESQRIWAEQRRQREEYLERQQAHAAEVARKEQEDQRKKEAESRRQQAQEQERWRKARKVRKCGHDGFIYPHAAIAQCPKCGRWDGQKEELE